MPQDRGSNRSQVIVSSRRARVALLVAVLAAALATPVSAQFPPDSFTNLRVLPRDIAPRALVDMMAGFTRALGVRCTFCHVGEETIPLEQYDFASDEKPAKRKARAMLEMVGRINDVHLAGLEERVQPEVRVECFTCHRGARAPRTLQQVLLQAYAAGGIDSTIAAYTALRQENYGSAVFDFGEVALIDVSERVIRDGQMAQPDRLLDLMAQAERLLDLNVRMNPESQFARQQLIIVGLTVAFADHGVEAGIARHTELKTRFNLQRIPQPVLNNVGYGLLRRSLTAQAVAVFRLCVEAYPQSANAHDSLGEGLAASGDIEQAIRSYERALELAPNNTATAEKLRELRRRRGRGFQDGVVSPVSRR